MINGSKLGDDTISVELPKGEYVLSFGAYYRFSRLIFPKDIAFFSSDKYYDNSGYPLQYVYAPKDVNEIIYRDRFGSGLVEEETGETLLVKLLGQFI